ncbi:cytochrome c biogenesis CcdA family protein [Streptomyces sp. URMC 125]|uniref:cytochrome c biogenesis CcdA family protein n=1 Tax=Streptomyces sp. URMC 125 TaxID=3423419 RepID=UPI003F1C0C9E
MRHLASVPGATDTVLSGGLLLAVPVALLAGLVSFFSPCVLPLIPGYLSYVTGIGGADLAEARRWRMVLGSSLFVVGFTAVFVSGGALFGYFGQTLLAHQEVLGRILGVLLVVMGLLFMGLLGGVGQRELRFHRRPAVGLAGAPLLGVLFGVGWTPCLGPTLSAVSFLAVNEASAARGALLTTVYCLGLGLPLVLTAVAFRRALGAFSWVKRHYVWVMRTGGGMLIALGVLMLTGVWDLVLTEIRGWTGSFTVGI